MMYNPQHRRLRVRGWLIRLIKGLALLLGLLLVGAWGIYALFIFQALFNTVLGEELLFRRILLLRMAGVFGKWDWVANGVIFGLYYLHQPWGLPGNILSGLLLAFTSRRYRSNWFPIILHSGQSVFFIALILGLVLGLA